MRSWLSIPERKSKAAIAHVFDGLVLESLRLASPVIANLTGHSLPTWKIVLAFAEYPFCPVVNVAWMSTKFVVIASAATTCHSLTDPFLYLRSDAGNNIRYCGRISCIVRILCTLVLLQAMLFQASSRTLHFIDRSRCHLLRCLVRHLPIEPGNASHHRVMSSSSTRR
jgi:hypothetical protein